MGIHAPEARGKQAVHRVHPSFPAGSLGVRRSLHGSPRVGAQGDLQKLRRGEHYHVHQLLPPVGEWRHFLLQYNQPKGHGAADADRDSWVPRGSSALRLFHGDNSARGLQGTVVPKFPNFFQALESS